ncbi:MAG: FkbM family methyltransferase [Chitinispirillia bacterium]|jgi:FkbM family methyltransferase
MLQKLPRENIRISNGINITVPSSVLLMTPYILMEQLDWFEDEIMFIRKILKRGDKVIDIGANYGVYSLSMALKVGNSGKVLAFEPTSYVAECLANSIKVNNFRNTELIKAGLSDRSRKAVFFTSPNSELNSLYPEDSSEGSYETIELISLDSCIDKFNWDRIDFIKLDAEGEEANILNGAKNTITRFSPLIMFEFKHGAKLNIPLIDRFESHGYKLYYLIPELALLVPFERDKSFDSFLLNLFCCKDDKARDLESQGVLIRSSTEIINALQDIENNNNYLWREYLLRTPFSKPFINYWDNPDKSSFKSGWHSYQQALNLYVLSKSEENYPYKRMSYLNKAYNLLDELVKIDATFPRLISLARCAFELGKRSYTVVTLSKIINNHSSSIQSLFIEPFLPVSKRYENVDPDNRPMEWVISSLLEQYEKLHAFSSYYTGTKSLPILKKLVSMGFQSQEMERRLHLIQKRFNTMSADQ